MNIIQRICCIVLPLLFLSACSSIPPYQELTFGGGWTDEKLSEGKYSLEYSGNGFASIEGVRQMWHKRAGELCGGEYEYEYSYDGEKAYDSYAAGPMPITFNFPTVIGMVNCIEKESANTPS